MLLQVCICTPNHQGVQSNWRNPKSKLPALRTHQQEIEPMYIYIYTGGVKTTNNNNNIQNDSSFLVCLFVYPFLGCIRIVGFRLASAVGRKHNFAIAIVAHRNYCQVVLELLVDWRRWATKKFTCRSWFKFPYINFQLICMLHIRTTGIHTKLLHRKAGQFQQLFSNNVSHQFLLWVLSAETLASVFKIFYNQTCKTFK